MVLYGSSDWLTWSDSSGTLIPGSVDNSEEEGELLVSPTAQEIISG